MLENARKNVVPLIQRLINPSINILFQVRKISYACEDLCGITQYGLSSATGT